MNDGEPLLADSGPEPGPDASLPVYCEHCRYYRPFQFCGEDDNIEAACLHPGNVIAHRSRLSPRRDRVDADSGMRYDNTGLATRHRPEEINAAFDCPDYRHGPDSRVQGRMGCAAVAIVVIFVFVIWAALGDPWMSLLNWLGIHPIVRTYIP